MGSMDGQGERPEQSVRLVAFCVSTQNVVSVLAPEGRLDMGRCEGCLMDGIVSRGEIVKLGYQISEFTPPEIGIVIRECPRVMSMK